MANRDTLYSALAAHSVLNLTFALFSFRGFLFSIVALSILAANQPKQLSSPISPTSLPAWEKQLMAAGRSGNYPKALSIANQYLKSHPHSCEALQWRFQIFNAMGNYEAGLQNINQKCRYYESSQIYGV